MPKLPKWTDEAAVERLVDQTLQAADKNGELTFDDFSNCPEDDPERYAVAQAKLGDFEPLANYLHPEHPFNKYVPKGKAFRDTLSPNTWKLIHDRLTGRWKRNVGKPRGVTKQSPVFAAAAEYPRIKRILLNLDPQQRGHQIDNRALEIAARRNGARKNALSNHLKRGKR